MTHAQLHALEWLGWFVAVFWFVWTGTALLGHWYARHKQRKRAVRYVMPKYHPSERT